MAISNLAVRSGVGSWTDIAHIITRGLDIGAAPAPPAAIAHGLMTFKASSGSLQMLSSRATLIIKT